MNNYSVYSDLEIRSTFYTESTLRKQLCKPKNWIAAADKKSSFMKLTVAIAKTFTSVNLNSI